jgi:hypothetical protein
MVELHLSDRGLYHGDLALYGLTQFFPFAVAGTVLAVATMGFWFIVVTNTLKGMWLGNLFQAPCLVKPVE